MPLIKMAADRQQRQIPPGMQPPENAADWFRITNSSEDADATDVFVYDSVGGWFGLYADEFIDALGGVTTSKINLRLNSPGGSVFEGITIANALRAHPASVTVYVDGLAASIASVIMLAGDRVVMRPQSQVMIHAASGACYGDSNDMAKMSETLVFQTRNIAEAYAERTGRSVEEFLDYMAAETWFTAKEAVALGLADEAMPMKPKSTETAPESTEARMHRSWDLSMYRYAGREQAPAPIASGFQVAASMADGLRKIADTTKPVVRAEAEPVKAVTIDLNLLSTDETFLNIIRDLVRQSLADAAPPFLPKKGEGDEEEDDDEDEEEAENASDDDPTDAAPHEPVTARSPRAEVVPVPPEGLAAGEGNPPLEHPVDTGIGHDTVESTETYDKADDTNPFVGLLHAPTTSSSADDVFAHLKEGW